MRKWQFSSFGLEQLRQVEQPLPAVTPGHVLVKVHAVSLNYRDLMVVRGHYNPRMALPRVPCSDGAGEIVEVGDGVQRFRKGDRVAAIFMQNWIDGRPTAQKTQGALGGDIDGMLSEYVLLHEDGLVAIPAHLSWEEAATLPCAGVTAWNAVVHAGRIKAGDTVVIQGTGGVSIFALQFARMLGARVLGTSSSDAKLAQAKDIGLDAGFNYKSDSNWAAWVLEQTGGEGADLVVEVGGSGTFAESLKAVRIGGTVAQIGVLSQGQEPLNIAPILMRQIRVRGIYVGSAANFNEMNQAIRHNRMKPVVHAVIPFDDAPSAWQIMAEASHFGKIVVKVTNDL